jgi:hypothetical protein
MLQQSLQEQREHVSELLPSDPLRDFGSLTSELRRYEAVLAYNLEHPYRYCQDYWWLEVLAEGPRAARTVAAEWVAEREDPRFECTDWVRLATPHVAVVRIPGDPEPLAVNWSVPVDEAWREGTIIRHPISGNRLGFIAEETREKAVLEMLQPRIAGSYRLLQHRPTSSADIVCLVPAVSSAAAIRGDI